MIQTKNNKGASVLAIMLLVFMALLLVITASYSFIVSSRADAGIVDSRFVEVAYAKEKQLNNNVYALGSKLVIEGYYSLAKKYPNVKDSDLSVSEFNVDFQGADIGIKNKLNKNVFEFYVENNDENRNKLRIYETTSSLQKLFFWEDELEEVLALLYYPSLNVKVNLTDLGLHSFEQIDSAFNECRPISDKIKLNECLSKKLPNFDVNVDDARNVKMSTKSRFYLDKEFKSIELNAKL